MRRISSGWTFFYKRVFPAIWFGFLILFFGISAFGGLRSNLSSSFPFLIVPIVMIFVGYFMMKKFTFDLVDEVWDDGQTLVVKNRGQEERIALADIKNVNYSPLINPPRVVLSLRRSTLFGDQVAFCAPVRFVPFAASPVIQDLIDRVDVARQKQKWCLTGRRQIDPDDVEIAAQRREAAEHQGIVTRDDVVATFSQLIDGAKRFERAEHIGGRMHELPIAPARCAG
jgi:hypothetical protein